MIPATTATSSTYVGNDIAYQFNFSFRALKASDIVVTATVGVSAAVTLVQGVDYSYSFSSFPLLGGSITLINAGQAWMTGAALKLNASLLIKYFVEPSQLSNLRNVSSSLLGLEVEKAIDKIVMDVSGIKADMGSTPSAIPVAFPSLTGNAGKLIQVNATEDAFEYLIDAQTILDAETAALVAETNALASEIAAEAAADSALIYKNATAADRAAVVIIQGDVGVQVGQAAGHASDALASKNAAAASAISAAAQVPLTTVQAEASAASAVESERSANLLLYTSTVMLTILDSPYQALTADKGKLFQIDTSGGNFIFNLPTIQPDEGWRVSVVKADSSINTVTVNPYGADTVAGGASEIITVPIYGHTYYHGLFSNWLSQIFIDNSSFNVGSPGNAGGVSFSAVQDIAASGTIVPIGTIQQVLNVQGNGGPQTANIIPFSANVADGVIIMLVGQDDAKILTILHKDVIDGLYLVQGDCYLGKGDTLAVVRNDVTQRYNELFRSVH